MNIDINIIRGLLTLIVFVAFVGIWAWAWSGKRKAVFDESAMLPLEDDATSSQREETRS